MEGFFRGAIFICLRCSSPCEFNPEAGSEITSVFYWCSKKKWETMTLIFLPNAGKPVAPSQPSTRRVGALSTYCYTYYYSYIFEPDATDD